MADNAAIREKTVEAQRRFALGSVALIRERYTAPIDIAGAGQNHHLQLSTIPATHAQMACYPEHWGPHRFERMGDLFLVPAHANLRARSDCSAQISIVCHLEQDLVTEWFGADLEWTQPRLLGSLDISSAELRRVMFRIGEELRSPGFAGDVMIELLAAQACIELSRYVRGIDVVHPVGGLPAWRTRLIDECLANNPGQATLSGLAGLCGLSVRHLTRAFRVTHNRSLGDYIAEHRMALAQRMLAAGSTIKDVAFAAGFAEPSNFAAAFRRATGRTPGKFRSTFPACGRKAGGDVPAPPNSLSSL